MPSKTLGNKVYSLHYWYMLLGAKGFYKSSQDWWFYGSVQISRSHQHRTSWKSRQISYMIHMLGGLLPVHHVHFARWLSVKCLVCHYMDPMRITKLHAVKPKGQQSNSKDTSLFYFLYSSLYVWYIFVDLKQREVVKKKTLVIYEGLTWTIPKAQLWQIKAWDLPSSKQGSYHSMHLMAISSKHLPFIHVAQNWYSKSADERWRRIFQMLITSCWLKANKN